MGRIIFDFVGVTLIIALIFGAISYFFPSVGNSSGAVTSVVAAMTTGQLYGQRTGQEVSSGFAWKVAAILTVVSLIIGAVVIAGFRLAGEPLLPEDINLDAGTIGLVFAIAGLIVFLISRFAFRWGVKTGARGAALRNKTKP